MKCLLTSLIMMLVAFVAKAQSCPDSNHPHAIDLGLPSGTKWACCNVGATTPEGSGSYYAWGETEEKEMYDWTTYVNCDGSMETCYDLGSNIAGTKYDVAHVKWGNSWMMPSQVQIQELTNKCSCTWTKINGVGGALFTGPSGSTIFLPEADFWRNGSVNLDNDSLDTEADELPSAGYYWASTLRASNSCYASSLLFSYGYAYWDSYNFRSTGLTIRPVISGSASNIMTPKSSADDNGQAVYNTYGIKVKNGKAGIKALPSGIYIFNGKKMLLK